MATRSYITNCYIDGSGVTDEWLFYVDEHHQTMCRLNGYAIIPKQKYSDMAMAKLKPVEVTEAVIALPTSEQQELYEFMHNALNLRIR